MAVAKLGSVVLDCPDPRALAEFYAGLLGGTAVRSADEEEGDEWYELEGAEGATLAFQRAPGLVPPKWPSADQSQQFHLDLTVEDMETAEQQALALGATVLERGEPGRTFRVYADPAGHPFCLCAG
ncbi:VOC family protein [Streptomyces triticagri]|uniref:VOC family protein n=1 Tax=Streptomyces triticagri TaxID=2293568 RepID=A0A372MCB9_9ACTN|nr:VOC family protein [Streptomyces triticagri]RFU87937.1 VOC family protein [Streptomyces triticagri]